MYRPATSTQSRSPRSRNVAAVSTEFVPSDTALDHPLVAEIDEGAVRSGHRFVDVVVGIVDVDDVDPIDAQPAEAALERPPHRVVAEVEPRLDLAVGTHVEQAADLGRDHDCRHADPAAPRRGGCSDSPSP